MPYCGANPIADMWSEKAMIAAGRRRSGPRCTTATTSEARGQMALAATFAGMGFGNAGVHIPHANAYPIAGPGAGLPPRRTTRPTSRWCRTAWRSSLTAPEAFRFTFEAAPGAAPAGRRSCSRPTPTRPTTRREFLPAVLADLMRDIDIPNGLGAVGYGEADVDDLVEGTLKQQRLLATAPREADRGRPRRRSSAARCELW